MNPATRHPSPLIPEAQNRPGDDPIFALNAAAKERAAAGEDVINSTLGALMTDDGRLAVMPTVSEVLASVPGERAAAYAPIAGDPEYLAAVIRDLFGDGPLAQQAVAVATPGGTGAVHHAIGPRLEELELTGKVIVETTDFYANDVTHAGLVFIGRTIPSAASNLPWSASTHGPPGPWR